MKENLLCLLKQPKASKCLKFWHSAIKAQTITAFSLVEMLMALLVASLLMAALAPVMTKKFSENVNVTGSMGSPASIKKTYEIEFGSNDCPDIKTDTDGSQYCEGEFEVPGGYSGMMKVTLIGAGGGGGAAPTAGYTEFTTVGSANTFTVPAVVNEIEATLISGGAGGGAGAQPLTSKDFTHSGDYEWPIPAETKNKYVLVSACGGGGGGGGQGCGTGGAGGNGGIIINEPWLMDLDKMAIGLGAGGGHGASGGCGISYSAGYTGKNGGGGGGIYSDNGWTASAAGNGGKVSSLTNCAAGGQGVDGNGGKGGYGSVPKNAAGCAAKGGNGSINDGSGGGGGAVANINAHSKHSGGGGGSSSAIGRWSQNKFIWLGGGGGGGGAQRVSGGGGGGGQLGGGGGGGAQHTVSVDSAPGAGGAGGNANGTNAGSAGAPNIGGRGGNGVWGYSSGTSLVQQTHQSHTWVASALPADSCLGGAAGKNGGKGAARVTWLTYGAGGGGGGAATMVPIQKVTVIPDEQIAVKIGRGGKGGLAGEIESNGNVRQPQIGEDSSYNTTEAGNGVTRLIRKSDGKVILGTCFGNGHDCGPISGSNDGRVYEGTPFYGKGGGAHNGNPNAVPSTVIVKGFTGTYGRTANNGTQEGAIVFPAKSTGGDGGIITTPFTGTCTPGKGGTEASPNGGNATGYGCGGGGGFSFGNGGAGSGGYARISWNKYWDATNKIYKLAETGAGGGGASGNIFTYNLSVKSNELIKIRIGKGGSGGNGSYASSANAADRNKLNGTKGGDTVFALSTNKQMTAGGGLGGGFPTTGTVDGKSVVINGIGGSISSICKTAANSSININSTKYCTKGIAGNIGEGNTGGKGADFKGYTYTVTDKSGNDVKKVITGTGGDGGAAGTTSDGETINDSIGAGGGGAGLRDIGETSTGSVTANPSRGGNGSNGKIILEWYVTK